MGKVRPMTPVEATSTSFASQPMPRAVSPAMDKAAERPSSPLQTFALPLFAMIARATPFLTCSRLTSTGAPLIRFVVNMPAQIAGSPATIRSRSRLFSSLMPHMAVPALNPAGATTPPSMSLTDSPPFVSVYRSGATPPTGIFEHFSFRMSTKSIYKEIR